MLVLGILASKCRWAGSNTAYTSNELRHHFQTSITKYVVTLPEDLKTVEGAIQELEFDVEVILFTDILKDSPVDGVRYIDGPNDGEAGTNTLRTLHDLLRPGNPPVFENRIQTIRPDDIAYLQSTSGTTGLPKMAVRTHRGVMLECMAIEDNNSQKPYEIRRLFSTPIFHGFTTPELVITPLRLGIPTYVMRRFDDTYPEVVHRFRITETAAPPPMLKMLLERPEIHHYLQPLRMIFSGGAPLATELRNRFLAIFHEPPRIVQVWGMTEGGWFATFKHPEDDTSGSVGRIIPGCEIKVSRQNRLQLPNGREASELLVKGQQVMPGYFGNDKASKEIFTVDGWLRTGDVGYVEDGKIYIVDRSKDLIKVNGWQVAPAEIEAAMVGSPGVKDAATIAVGHGVDEHPLLFVVPIQGGHVDKDVIVDHLSSRVARHKIGKMQIEVIDSIPRNPSGKILRRLLREVASRRDLI